MKDTKKSEIHFSEPTLVWLGDPCYAPGFNWAHGNDDVWNELCDLLFPEGQHSLTEASYVFEHEGTEFVFGGTAHGDGCYPVSSGGSCGVDAGLLSVIPAGKFGLVPDNGEDYGGVFVTVQGSCYMDEEGTLWAGNVHIKTEYDDEEEDICDWCGNDYHDCTCGQEEEEDEEEDWND